MRLEKIFYERLVNNKLLSRARTIGKPSLSHDETNLLMMVPPYFGIKKLFNPFKRWLDGMEWRVMMSGLRPRGLAPEDWILFRSEELRRDPLFEHANRESLHPFMRENIRLRMHRYYKVDEAVKGFEVPEYVKEEAKERYFFRSLGNVITYRHFFKQNYQNDQTPNSNWFMTSLNIIELFLMYNSTLRNGWARYFWNEEHYYTTGDYVKETNSPKDKLDLSNENDFKQFFKRAQELNQRYPGYFAPEGQEPNYDLLKKDYEEMVAQTKWDHITTEDLTDYGLRWRMANQPFIQPKFDGEEAKGKSNVGLDLPRFLRKWNAKGFFN